MADNQTGPENTNNPKGHCLCGAVHITAPLRKNTVGACHCGMCRRWVGGPFMAVDCGTDLEVQGQENIVTYASSEWADRAFCRKCGSALYYYLKPKAQYIVSAGLFEDQSYEFDHQIFVEEKPSYYDFSNQTHNMTGEEVFAEAQKE